MARKFKTPDYEATLDSTITLRDALPADHLARFIVDLVTKLDFSQFYARYAESGAPPYAPELLFGLLLYGYCTGVFSSRKIEKATAESLPFRFLAGGQQPDHDTIANFRQQYKSLLEAICGTTDDSQPVEQYDGTLGVTRAFVDAHERAVGQLQWNDNLATIYNNPGNVSGERWCTGTLISANLFLTAGHCFDQSAHNWQLPRINGTNNVIPSSEIATNMHVNFNYQVDPDGNPRTKTEFAIEELVEYRLGGLDFAIVRLAGSPSQTFGTGTVAQEDADEQDMICIIGHPLGVPKRIEAGPVTSLSGNSIRYNDIDTLGGNSGSAIWHSPSGEIVGVHTNGGCNASGTGTNSGVRISRLLEESPTLTYLFSPALQGMYTLQQKINSRFLDAHETAERDFAAVTRTAQNNDSQRWVILSV